MKTLESILSTLPVFEGLDARTLDLIAGCAANERFEAGDFLFREGQEATRFYIVRQGRVSVEVFTPDRGPIEVESVGEGDTLGWSWLIPPHVSRFDARALELTRVIAIDGTCLRTKCETDHDLGYTLLLRFTSIMERRIEAMRLQLLDIYGMRT
jgi:CRP-like cAMP-binding protein